MLIHSFTHIIFTNHYMRRPKVMSINRQNNSKAELRKEVTLFRAVMFGIGGMIGAGIFALSGDIARDTGIYGAIVFGIASFLALSSGLVYAEYSTLVVSAGGGYSYVRAVFPDILGFLAGWWFFLAYSIAATFYVTVFGIYVEIFLGIPFLIPALATVIIFALINFIGIKESSIAEILLVVFKLSVLGVFIFLSLIRTGFLEQAFDAELNIIEILIKSATILIAFEGFDIIATLSQEMLNPTKDAPRSIIISIVTVSMLYVLVIFAILNVIPYKSFPPGNTEEIILTAAAESFGRIGYLVILSAALISTLSAANAALIAVSRVGYAMGTDHILPRQFRLLHPKTNTPYASIFMGSLLILIVLFFMTLFVPKREMSIALAGLASLAFSSSFALVDFSIIIHRNLFPTVKRGFKVPLYPLIPIIGMVSAIYVAILTALENLGTFYLFIILTGLGIAYYALICREVRTLEKLRMVLLSDFIRAKAALGLGKVLVILMKRRPRRARRKTKRA
ncbi:MAG: hypothetical protein DRZ80_03295 [Thermoprotei archaeon]|nr:MAG: hypothetical protein DRZ80_03295 [Thermoprotei archaeon]